MGLYSFLEKPKIYNFIGKILSLGNQSSLERSLLELVKSKEDDLLLDVGCGTGDYAESLPGIYYGVDINKDYINYAKNKHKGNFLVADATNLKFSDNKFDLVYLISILHHLPDEKVKMVLDETKRVCRRGGKIFILEAVYPPKLNFIGYLLFKFDRGKHTRTVEHLNDLLKDGGFNLLKSSIKGTFPYKFCVFAYQKL